MALVAKGHGSPPKVGGGLLVKLSFGLVRNGFLEKRFGGPVSKLEPTGRKKIFATISTKILGKSPFAQSRAEQLPYKDVYLPYLLHLVKK